MFSLDELLTKELPELFQVANLETTETAAVDMDAIVDRQTIGGVNLVGSTLFDDLEHLVTRWVEGRYSKITQGCASGLTNLKK